MNDLRVTTLIEAATRIFSLKVREGKLLSFFSSIGEYCLRHTVKNLPHRRLRSLVLTCAAILPLIIISQAAPLEGALSSQVSVTIRPKDKWPPKPVTDLDAIASVSDEGEALLMWTAPVEDDLPQPSNSPVSQYYIRYATFSISDLGGNTTTWWNNGTDLPVSNMIPRAPGESESFIVTGLEPGATIYFALKTRDKVNNMSLIDTLSATGAQSHADILDVPPPIVTGVTSTATSTSITISWNPSTATDIMSYRIYWDSVAPADVFVPTVTVPAGTNSYAFANLNGQNTYYFYITAIDKGLPRYLGNALESARSAVVGIMPTGAKKKLAKLSAPVGVVGSLTANSKFMLQWSPVTTNVDGTTVIDLAGYSIYRSSSMEGPYMADFSCPAGSSTWVSYNTVPPALWYMLRAFDSMNNESDDSMVIEASKEPSMAVSCADGTMHIVFPYEQAQLLNSNTNKALSEDIRIAIIRNENEEQGNILGSYEVKSFGAISGREVLDLKITKPLINFIFRYQPGTHGAYLPSAAVLRNIKIGTISDASIFWNNKVEYVKFGGIVDEQRGELSIKSAQPLGKYQIRNVLRASDFVLNQLTPRKIFTPNGDGVNDDIFLFMENPKDSSITQAKIYDITGTEVADFEQGMVSGASGIISLKWNGRDTSGNYVRSGVYIYQIKAEGKVLNGTIVVAR